MFTETWSNSYETMGSKNKFCWSSNFFAPIPKFWSHVGLLHIGFPGKWWPLFWNKILYNILYLTCNVFSSPAGNGNYCLEPFWSTFFYISSRCFQKCNDNLHNGCFPELPSRYDSTCHSGFLCTLTSFNADISTFCLILICMWNVNIISCCSSPSPIVPQFLSFCLLKFSATLELVLNWKAWRSLECSQMIRYILKFIVAIAWLIILPATYASSIQNPTGLVKFFSNWIGNLQGESVYNFAIAIYMLPNIFSALFFIFLPIRRALERSNSRIIRFLLWWNQVRCCLFNYICVH